LDQDNLKDTVMIKGEIWKIEVSALATLSLHLRVAIEAANQALKKKMIFHLSTALHQVTIQVKMIVLVIKRMKKILMRNLDGILLISYSKKKKLLRIPIQIQINKLTVMSKFLIT
jgi:hypothetical protein